MVLILPCDNCGIEMKRSPSHVKNRKNVFCSRACRKEFHRPLLECRGCGNQFQRNPKTPQTQYCSWECFKASRHITETCTVCGTKFDSYLSEARKRQERGHIPCCSRSCRNTYTSTLLGGDGNWIAGGKYNPKRRRGYIWRKTRLAYLRHIGGMCEGCEGTKAIEVHHLHPVAAGGDLLSFDNLMAVCADCHAIMHEQLREGAFWCSFEGAELAEI